MRPHDGMYVCLPVPQAPRLSVGQTFTHRRRQRSAAVVVWWPRGGGSRTLRGPPGSDQQGQWWCAPALFLTWSYMLSDTRV